MIRNCVLTIVVFVVCVSSCCAQEWLRRFDPTRFQVCTDADMKGQCKSSHLLPDKQCINLRPNDAASSIDPMRNCVRIYKDANCLGKSKTIYYGNNGQNYLGDDFNDVVSSVGYCFEDDMCYNDRINTNKKRKKRQPGNSSGWHCQFAADVLEVGIVSDLNEDTSNLRAPVVHYQTRQVGAVTRTEGMQAHIFPRHLDRGTDVSTAVRTYVQQVLGTSADHSGHILGNRLGGPGDDRRNIMPQTPHFNQGAWSGVEDVVYNMVNEHAADGIRYNVNLLYHGTDTRPYEILYRIANLRTDEPYQVGDVSNVVVPEDMINRSNRNRNGNNNRDIFRNTFVDPNNWHGVAVPDELEWVNRYGSGSNWRNGRRS